MRMQVLSLALLSGLRIQHYCGCGVGNSYNSDWTPSLGTYIYRGWGPKKAKKKKIVLAPTPYKGIVYYIIITTVLHSV